VTTNEIDRGGRPRQFDEDELITRIRDFDDLVLIEAALVEHTSHPTWAKGCVGWLLRKRAGQTDTPGSSAARYRRMLAELPFDPLKPPGGRRRALRELASQRGSADLVLVAGFAAAGMLAMAVFSPSEAVRLAGIALAPIMPEQSSEAAGADSGARVVPLWPMGADGTRECVLGARPLPPVPRVGYTPLEVAA
jgi:hypothetical protein